MNLPVMSSVTAARSVNIVPSRTAITACFEGNDSREPTTVSVSLITS